MEETEKKAPYPEEESDFGYLAKLSEAYKRAQAERRKLELNDEKRAYLAEMQRELASMGRALFGYFEREEKKELALFLYKNAEDVLRAIDAEAETASLPESTEIPFVRALLLANRSLDALRGRGGYGDLTHMILAELSALYALAAMR